MTANPVRVPDPPASTTATVRGTITGAHGTEPSGPFPVDAPDEVPVDVAALRRALDRLDPAEPWLALGADAAAIARLRAGAENDCDVVATAVALTDAVKRVDADGVVVAGFERGELVRLATPALLRRAALVDAIAGLPPGAEVDALALVAAGGRVRIA